MNKKEKQKGNDYNEKTDQSITVSYMQEANLKNKQKMKVVNKISLLCFFFLFSHPNTPQKCYYTFC